MVLSMLQDTWNICWRELKHFARSRAAMFSTLIQPVVWLAFMGNAFNFSNSTLFGSVPQGLLQMLQPYLSSFSITQIFFGASSYLEFFAPAVIVMTMLFGGIFGGVSIVWDRRLGYLNKMLAAPISRTSIGTGKMISVSLRSGLQAIIIGAIAVAMGVTIATGLAGFIVAVLIAMLLCLAFAGISMSIGATVKNMDTMFPVLNLFTMPLLFMSPAMFSQQMMPDWLSTISQYNPVTYAIQPIRELFISGWDWATILPDVAIVGAFALVMMGLATILFRRSVS
jgi:ABC-2 type transport system permease protein